MVMLKWLEPVLPHIQNAAAAMAVLLAAYLVTIPLRRRYRPSEGVDLTRRTGRDFVGALASYLAFPVLVLLISLAVIYRLNRGLEHDQWSPYHPAWLSFWGIYAALRLVEGLFVEIPAQMGRACPLTRLTRSLLRLVIMLGVAFMVMKYQLDFNISVLLTSTAIVTGVVGFAMQGVLGNLLAGMSLHASRTISVGDWVEIDGQIGQVILVGYRETRLRTLGGHIVVVPNGKLAEMTVRNFSLQTNLRRHEVPVAASYGDAPGDVIAALIEAAQSISEVESNPAPDAYVTAFRDFGIEYVLRFWSRQYQQRTRIEGHVMRMIWYKFTRRGIEIPFPMSGRMLGTFMEAVHAQRFEMPPASEIQARVNDLVRSDFGRKLVADASGNCLLTRDELKALARDVNRVRFTRGEVLMRQNEDGESFYVLVRGRVQGDIATSEAAAHIQFELPPGSVFGEMSLLTGLPRSATMAALTDCELLEFDREAFAHLLSLREEIPLALSNLAAARAAENTEAGERLRQCAATPDALACQGIMRRLKRMLSEWRGR